uniref:Multimerin 2 n=1 Tax=Malurus cyaneus samueli TaxID=2593467 RepID=A0A8C5TN84_9PASS
QLPPLLLAAAVPASAFVQDSVPHCFHNSLRGANFFHISLFPRLSSPRNWCSFTQSRLVTYIEACMKEKYIVNSQQPCPNGAPECQKIMYRTALKPVYQVKQKLLKSLQWKCCPGFIGKDCEQRGKQSWRTENAYLSYPDPQERLLQQVLFPHVENFLRKHFNPVWASFNRSLQNLSNIVRNLSHDVDANKKSIERFQESTVPKKEFQELGTKFESKVQENTAKVDQVKRDIENQVHMQQANILYNLSMIKADTDTKLKKLQKIQQSHFSALNNSIANMKHEQNLLENKLEALKRNLTQLSSHRGPKDENSQLTILQINEVLSGHAKQLKELYMESDVAFQNIVVLERWFKELKQNISKFRPEDLTITLAEKSVIMEENNAAMERQIAELNYTLSNLRENYSDLLRYMEECNCQRVSSDTDGLEEDTRNSTYSLVDTQSRDMKHLESVLRDLFKSEIEELSSAIPSIHLSLSLRQAENRQLQSQVTAFSEDIGLLKKKDEDIHRHIKYLNSSFSSLLKDAMRHEEALEALLRHKLLDLFYEDDFSSLVPSVFELEESLKHISDQLQEQNMTLSSLTRRFHSLERDSLVAFHVGFSERKDKGKTVRFNETYLNYGNSYFSEHGHFKAPHKGVYLFVISVEFGSGPALGQLSFSRGYKRTLSSSQRKTPHGNTMTTFAMAEMEKGETVCFELLQGSVVKRSPPGTTMGGFLISKT